MRYIPHTPEEIQSMLKTVGLRSITELFATIPEALRLESDLKLPEPLDEAALLSHLQELGNQNKTIPLERSFLGGGIYRHHIPAAVKNLIQRSEFVTPYTPYQPEIAQGTLQVLFEFQTMVCQIFDMEVANASLYDGSTSLAEALLMGLRIQKKGKKILLPRTLHPQYREVVQTIFQNIDAELVDIPYTPQGTIDRAAWRDYLTEEANAVVIPYPNYFGVVEDCRDLVQAAKEKEVSVIFCVTEPLSLGMFASPGSLGADIVCGEGQSFGLFPSFSGPYAGLFATREKYLRQMPGRLCGLTQDAKGRRGFVLTLSTREQHIRREKATSNICTNQGLCATQIAIYLSLLGKQGLAKLARLNWEQSEYAKQKLTGVSGVSLPFAEAVTFNEFVLQLPKPTDQVLERLQYKGFSGGIDLRHSHPELRNAVLVSVTECNRKEDIDSFAAALKEACQA